MTGAEALARLAAAYGDRSGEVARRKAAGRGVVGYFLNAVPVELIVAAGLDPVRLVGDPARAVAIADRYMEEYFDGEVRAIFAALVEGDWSALDLLVVPRTAEVYLQLYYFLREIPNWEPAAALPPVQLWDFLQTQHFTTARYDLGRMRDLAGRLAAVGGRTVDDAALRGAIGEGNRLRAGLAEVAGFWRGATRRLSGVDALRVIGGAAVLAPEEAVATLAALAADPPAPLATAGPRLMLKGSPQHDTRFCALVERCGAAVVAHDHVAGDRTFAVPVATVGDPWEALVHHYQCAVPGPRAYPQAREDAAFLALARDARVDGVIFYHDEWDDTLGWEYPDQKQALDAAGIPSLFLKRQAYLDPPEDAQRDAVSAFVASIGKGA